MRGGRPGQGCNRGGERALCLGFTMSLDHTSASTSYIFFVVHVAIFFYRMCLGDDGAVLQMTVSR